MTVRCLTVHSHYGCRHSGACCTAGWPIPVEADRLTTLTAAVEDGRLVASSPKRPMWMRPAGAPASTPAELQFDHNGCVFYDTGDGGRCRIHRVLGHDALPLACRQFPRVSVIDPRGASVTLSHYCPTAAGLLDKSEIIAITEEALAFPAATELVGLDARTNLPPLLAPGMLMDWEAWWDWERRAVDTIAQADRAPEESLRILSTAVEHVRGWTPAEGPLSRKIDEAFRRAFSSRAESRPFVPALDDALSAIPPALRPRKLEPAKPPSDAATRAFVAAHAFANWTIHLGQGLRTWRRSIEAAWLLAAGLGVRQADLILRHLADPNELARLWSRAEVR